METQYNVVLNMLQMLEVPHREETGTTEHDGKLVDCKLILVFTRSNEPIAFAFDSGESFLWVDK